MSSLSINMSMSQHIPVLLYSVSSIYVFVFRFYHHMSGYSNRLPVAPTLSETSESTISVASSIWFSREIFCIFLYLASRSLASRAVFQKSITGHHTIHFHMKMMCHAHYITRLQGSRTQGERRNRRTSAAHLPSPLAASRRRSVKKECVRIYSATAASVAITYKM